MAPSGARLAWARRLPVIAGAWGVIVMVFVVSGGIYGGVFTVLEAAAVGCIFAILFTWYRGKLNWPTVRRVLGQTAATTGFIYIIIFGANIFSAFITITQLPEALAGGIRDAGLSPPMVLFLLLVMYIVLGAIFDTVAAMIITLPVVFPLMIDLGYNPIWWGVINIMVIEIGQTTPPIGIIPFVLHGMRPEHSAADDLLWHRAVFCRRPHTARHRCLVPAIGALAARIFWECRYCDRRKTPAVAGWGKISYPPHSPFTPTLTLPLRGGGDLVWGEVDQSTYSLPPSRGRVREGGAVGRAPPIALSSFSSTFCCRSRAYRYVGSNFGRRKAPKTGRGTGP